jgi:hypothetical protein
MLYVSRHTLSGSLCKVSKETAHALQNKRSEDKVKPVMDESNTRDGWALDKHKHGI